MKSKISKDLLVKNKNKIIFWSIVVCLTIFACYPYLNHLTLWGHDMSFHLNRIIGISDGIKSGNFPVYINSSLVDGMGYSTSIFYPEIFLYIPAILNVIGLGIGVSYKLFIISITFFTFLSMYYAINKIFGKKEMAIIASLLYTFSLYRLEDVFVRAALGEILAFVFLPIVILGIYELLFGDKNKWYILALGLFGLSCSHIISIFLAVLLIIVLCVFNIKSLLNDKVRIKKILICGAFSLILCCNMYLPMLEQILDTPYRFSVGKSAYDLSDNMASITSIFENNLDSSTLLNSKENLAGTDRMNYGIGLILIILPICIIFLKREKQDLKRKFINQLILIGFFLIFAITEFFQWKYFGFMSVIQFPWRLNLISTLVLSISAAYVAYNLLDSSKLSKYSKEIFFVFSLLIIYNAGIQLQNSGYKVDAFEYNELIEDLPIGAGEYLPIQFKFDKNILYTEINIFDVEKEVMYPYVKNGNELDFSYNESNKSNSGIIVVPITYYKGYRAYIIDGNNIKTELAVLESKTGTVEVNNSNQKTGIIHIEYKMTNIQLCSYIITIISLIGIFIIRKKITKKMKKHIKLL